MKIMGIDYGDARTGVSISDPTGFLAGSPQVIATWNTEKLLEELTAEERQTFALLLHRLYARSKQERREGFPHVIARLEETEGDA